MPSVATPSPNTAVTSPRDYAPWQCFPAGLSQNCRILPNIVWAAATDSEVNQTVEVPRIIREIACEFLFTFGSSSGSGSVLGIATGYGLDNPGIESRWRRDFPHLSRPALGPTLASCTMGTVSFPWVKSGRGVTLTPHPF